MSQHLLSRKKKPRDRNPWLEYSCEKQIDERSLSLPAQSPPISARRQQCQQAADYRRTGFRHSFKVVGRGSGCGANREVVYIDIGTLTWVHCTNGNAEPADATIAIVVHKH